MDFYEKIRRVCLEIPYGKAATYGQIALLCGKPKNSRQVGYALRTGKAGEGLPAHRVVNASGILSGAHAFATPDLQKRMLEAEGVEVCRTEKGWQVDIKKYGWKHTAEDAERFYYMFQQKTGERDVWQREKTIMGRDV
ncbi:MAG: MGMT family protein [Dorea sp.]|jgi:methylated-DNA-protein-cysteine methyltransferase-like protein|nr:MGMT family protein [Dorea sp.]